MRRRDSLKLPAAGAATGLARAIDEDDPANVKLARRLSARISGNDLLFLKLIGLRRARVEFGDGPSPSTSCTRPRSGSPASA